MDFKLTQLRADVYSSAGEFNRAMGDYFGTLREGVPPEERQAHAEAVRLHGQSYIAALDALIAYLQSLTPDAYEADELERACLFKELAMREIDLAERLGERRT